MKEVKLKGGRKIIAHERSQCAGEICCIHNPSDHHMVNWPQNWRNDTKVMERQCEHGVGHPDPDDIAHKQRVLEADPSFHQASPFPKKVWEAVHGCDGCCNPKNKYATLD